MHVKIIAPFTRNHQNAAMWLLVGLMAQSVLLISPGYSATYRCHDESGTRVLTDNPAQLLDCTLLQSQSSSTINGAPPTSKIQNAKSDVVPNLAYRDSPVTDKLDSEEEGNPDSQPSGEITVPLTKSGGSLVVHVMLNQERSAQLIVDTGASMTVLSTQAAIDLGILGTTDNELLTINTAGGSVQVNMNYLPSLTVGTAQVTNVAVVIHDLPDIPEHIEGLLGMSFLKHFLVTLDAEHARLILRPKQQQ
jgi:clan AA aspartic protease (TIGR02281 family)